MPEEMVQKHLAVRRAVLGRLGAGTAGRKASRRCVPPAA
jgi:hypothetical protein